MTTTRLPRRVMASGLAGAAILAGAGVAALVNHDGSKLPVVEIQNAAASGSTSTTSPSATNAANDDPKPGRPAPLDEATDAKVKAAALAAVPGATYDHGHKMRDGSGYKALVTKADGTKVLVTEDNAFKVTKVEDPAPSRPGRGPRHQRLDDATLAKVKAAALDAVPGATFRDAFKLRDDEGYKAMLVKADGTTKVLVTEDANFTVTKVEDPAPTPPERGPHGDRVPLDEATAAKVKAAALEAVPGATVDRVGRDRSGDGFIALLTKSDGTTHVLVHEDANYKVTKVQDPAPARPEGGLRRGGHPGPEGPGFGDGGDAPAPDGSNA